MAASEKALLDALVGVLQKFQPQVSNGRKAPKRLELVMTKVRVRAKTRVRGQTMHNS